MDFEDITPDKLSSLLADKHQRFMRGYKSELKTLERMMILNETIDQLSHWIKEGRGDVEKHFKKRGDVERELLDLRGQLPYTNPERRLKDLRGRMQGHEEAMEFWKNERRRTERES